MDIALLFKNLFSAFLSQGTALLCSVVTTLAVPKIMGVYDFGYWQYFIFLVSYVSFFQLGINDGVYLVHGGETRSIIDKGLIKREFILSVLLQCSFMFLIIVGNYVFGEGSDKFGIVACASVYMVVSNATFFLGYVFQAMNETSLFSLSIVADRVVFLFPLLLCIAFNVTNYYAYIFLYIIARIIALAFCLYCAKDFFSSASASIKSGLQALLRDAKIGIVLTFANICSMLILGVARYIVEAKWGMAVFGQLSLSLSLVNFLLMFVSQLSMVLFPALRQLDSSALAGMYNKIRNSALMLLPASFIAYYPLYGFISAWLPDYADSLSFLVFLMPIVLYESMADMVYVTFFKVRCEPKSLLAVNLSSLLIALCLCLIGAYVFDSVYLVMASAVCGLACRAYFGDLILSKGYGAQNPRLLFLSLGFSVAFVVINSLQSILVGAAGTLLLISAYGILNLHEARETLLSLRALLRGE